MPRNDDIPLKCFKLTVSPKGDIPTEVVQSISKYLQKNTAMCHIVLENGESGKLHLHALMCYNLPVVKRNITDSIWKRFVKDKCEEGTTQFVAVKMHTNYDNNWITEYLRKEETRKEVFSNYDVERESDYYPTKEQQKLLKERKAVATAADPFFCEHEIRFLEYYNGLYPRPPDPPTPVSGEKPKSVYIHPRPPVMPAMCYEYFAWRMFKERNMKCTMDERRLRQMAYTLFRYVTQDIMPDFDDRKWFAGKVGPTMDFSG